VISREHFMHSVSASLRWTKSYGGHVTSNRDPWKRELQARRKHNFLKTCRSCSTHVATVSRTSAWMDLYDHAISDVAVFGDLFLIISNYLQWHYPHRGSSALSRRIMNGAVRAAACNFNKETEWQRVHPRAVNCRRHFCEVMSAL